MTQDKAMTLEEWKKVDEELKEAGILEEYNSSEDDEQIPTDHISESSCTVSEESSCEEIEEEVENTDPDRSSPIPIRKRKRTLTRQDIRKAYIDDQAGVTR
jgi:hypothetical protein